MINKKSRCIYIFKFILQRELKSVWLFFRTTRSAHRHTLLSGAQHLRIPDYGMAQLFVSLLDFTHTKQLRFMIVNWRYDWFHLYLPIPAPILRSSRPVIPQRASEGALWSAHSNMSNRSIEREIRQYYWMNKVYSCFPWKKPCAKMKTFGWKWN